MANRPPKSYPVGIVGESNYQPAIRRCRPGQSVTICHERGNPTDPQALCVHSAAGEPIGYIGRDNWVRKALHESGTGCVATIKSIDSGEARQLGVVLDLTLANHPLPVREFARPAPAADGGTSLGRFLAGLVKGFR